jgi:hypothetical protein
MKRFALLFAFVGLISTSNAQYVKWGKQFGPDYRGITPLAMTTDDAGNSYVIGDDRVTITNSIAFIWKFSPTGQLLGSYYFSDPYCLAFMNFRKVVADRYGNMFILGNSTCDRVKAGSIIIQVSGGEVGSYILKLNPNGSVNYLTDIADNMMDLAADYHGNVYVSGTDKTQKLDSLGNISWTNNNCKGHAIDVSPDGRSFVTNGNAVWRISPTGSKSWQNLTLGGWDIAYNRWSDKIFITRSGGLTEVRINPFLSIQYSLINGDQIKCDLSGQVFLRGSNTIQRLSNVMVPTGNIAVPFASDFGISKDGQAFMMGHFNNENIQQIACSFITHASDPNYCLDNCRDDGYLVKVSFDQAPLNTYYNYPSACYGQSNPVEFCSDGIFNPGNSFYVELSGPNGGFNNAVNLGAPPNITLPAGLPPGNNYKFRVNSTSPAITGIPSTPFSIDYSPGPLTIQKVGAATLCDSGYVNFIAADTLGNAVNVNWFGDIDYLNNFNYLSTNDTLTVSIGGYFYAEGYACYSQTATFDSYAYCRTASNQKNITSLTVYPNPASDQIHLNIIANESGICNIRLIDISGKTQRTFEQNLTFGPNNAEINVSDLSPGLYILQMSDGKYSVQQKVVVN